MVKWPWDRPELQRVRDDAPAPQPTPVQPAPQLLRIVVQPVNYKGEALCYRLVMQFDTGEIDLGQAADMDKLMALGAEIRETLGMTDGTV